jgi:hypothetical protein
MIVTPGIVERLTKVLEKSAKMQNKGDEWPPIVLLLEEAINKEIKIIQAIKDMPAFRSWIEGERIDLAKANWK